MKRMTWIPLLPAASLALVLAACGQEQEASQSSPAPDTAEPGVSVHFVSPADGARVTSPFRVEMAAEGVEVVPAGTMREGTGHMHILVDVPFVMPGNVIPSDDQHIHYGDGSTSATLELPPGEHVLRLQLADGAHTAFEGGEYRDVIVVDVQGREGSAAAEATAEPENGGPVEESDQGAGNESGESGSTEEDDDNSP